MNRKVFRLLLLFLKFGLGPEIHGNFQKAILGNIVKCLYDNLIPESNALILGA